MFLLLLLSFFCVGTGRDGETTVALAALFKGEPRPVLLRLLHAILADLPRNQRDVTEVDVDVVVGVVAGSTGRSRAIASSPAACDRKTTGIAASRRVTIPPMKSADP